MDEKDLIIRELAAQRNSAMDAMAVLTARIQLLQAKLSDMEKEPKSES